uniref:Reverse transcriptase zinc-binding domain-containing protein n=1 Tax=Lactuca sativa TaxID=4236 RepID=A0A9R1X8C0_LACSA|nr:hypothetical protein LSAT_V11C600329480 [Lactuca sativa]
MIWSLEPSRMDIVASFRRFINETILPKTSARAWHWNNPVPGKVNILAWQVFHRRLLTRVNINNIGIRYLTTFPLCNIDEESESHLLTECSISQEVCHSVQNWWIPWKLSGTSLSLGGAVLSINQYTTPDGHGGGKWNDSVEVQCYY